MRQQTVVLVGLGAGLLFTAITQYFFPLTLFFPRPSFSFYIDPITVMLTYLTVPVLIGGVVGLVDRQRPGKSGLISGAVTGVVNLLITDSYLQNLLPQAQTDLNFFALVLTMFWAFLAACVAKATAWSLENPSIRPVV